MQDLGEISTESGFFPDGKRTSVLNSIRANPSPALYKSINATILKTGHNVY